MDETGFNLVQYLFPTVLGERCLIVSHVRESIRER
jgi:hypothetical protein